MSSPLHNEALTLATRNDRSYTSEARNNSIGPNKLKAFLRDVAVLDGFKSKVLPSSL